MNDIQLNGYGRTSDMNILRRYKDLLDLIPVCQVQNLLLLGSKICQYDQKHNEIKPYIMEILIKWRNVREKVYPEAIYRYEISNEYEIARKYVSKHLY
jgi:hypothetical protein